MNPRTAERFAKSIKPNNYRLLSLIKTSNDFSHIMKRTNLSEGEGSQWRIGTQGVPKEVNLYTDH